MVITSELIFLYSIIDVLDKIPQIQDSHIFLMFHTALTRL